jgi:hypothetical protein
MAINRHFLWLLVADIIQKSRIFNPRRKKKILKKIIFKNIFGIWRFGSDFPKMGRFSESWAFFGSFWEK